MKILEEQNQTDLLKIFIECAKDRKKQSRKFWMSRFDDEVILNSNMFWDKPKYIHNNPVKAGLVNIPEDFIYSSARNYSNNDHSIININTEIAGIDVSWNGP